MDISKKIDELLLIAVISSIEAGKEILKIYNNKNIGVELKKDLSPLTLADKKSHNKIIEFLTNTEIPVLSEEGKGIPYSERKKWNYFWLVDPLDGTKEFINRNDEFTVNIAFMKKNTPVMGVIYAPVLDTLYFGSPNSNSNKLINASKIINRKIKLNELLNKSAIISHNSTFNNSVKVIVSRSHMSKETEEFINKIKKRFDKIQYKSKGSSLKFCLIAEGECDIYPRFGPTMEWDTAAGHAIAQYADCSITLTDYKSSLSYNKENLLNPWFIVKSKKILNL